MSRHTGGVITYVKKQVKQEIVRSEAKEGSYWALLLKVTMNKKEILLIAVYRSPNGCCDNFLTYFENIINGNFIISHR